MQSFVRACAITGSVPQKKNNSAVPTMPAEQENPSSDPALPADEHLWDLMLGEIKRQLPLATWAAAEIGVDQARVLERVLARGGDRVRTGLEDNVRISNDRQAASKAELVQLAAEACGWHGRRPATVDEARAVPGL